MAALAHDAGAGTPAMDCPSAISLYPSRRSTCSVWAPLASALPACLPALLGGSDDYRRPIVSPFARGDAGRRSFSDALRHRWPASCARHDQPPVFRRGRKVRSPRRALTQSAWRLGNDFTQDAARARATHGTRARSTWHSTAGPRRDLVRESPRVGHCRLRMPLFVGDGCSDLSDVASGTDSVSAQRLRRARNLCVDAGASEKDCFGA